MGLGEEETPRRTLKSVCGKCETEVMHWVHYAAAGMPPFQLYQVCALFYLDLFTTVLGNALARLSL